MNFKRMNFLLIMLALVLLVGIGSVSAASDDGTDIISDGITDDMLLDDGVTENTDPSDPADPTEPGDSTDPVAEKINTTVESANVTARDNETASIPVTVKDNETTIPVNGSDFSVSEGNKTLNFTYVDSNITITSNLTAGVHNITILYKGNATYGNATANVILNVYKNMTLEAPSSIDVNTTKNATISFNLTNGIDYINLTSDDITNGNLTVVVTYLNETNETVTVNISNKYLENNTITFTLDDNNFTSGNVTLSYNKTYNATVALNNIVNVIITPNNTNGSYQTGNLTFKVTDADGQINLTNKTIEVKYSTYTGSITLVTPITLTINEEGIASLNLNTVKVSLFDGNSYYNSYIPVGIHELSIGGLGQLKGNNKTNVTIEKANVIITANKFTGDYGTAEKYKITVTSAKTGELMKSILLSIYMPQTSGKYYNFTTNENGTCEITVSGLVGGDYNVTVSTIDNNTNNASKNSSIVINKVKVKIDTSSKTMYYNSGSTAKITIKNAKTGKAVAGVYVFVRLYTSSTKYNDYLFMTNSNGVVEFSAPLDVGKHKMIVATADTRYEGSSVTKTITVKNAPAKITAAKKTAYYKQGKYFVVKVTNTKNNKPIYNAKLNIRVFVSSTKYYNFNGRTGANGQIKLSMDFKPGTYKVVVIDNDSNMVAKQITSKMVINKAPAKFSAPKVTAKKKANKYFKVKVINKKTKKIIPGVKVKVKVYTGKKSKTYTIKTNSKGIAKLSTKSLKVGNHKVVITSANKYVKASKKTSSIKITK